MIKVRLLPDCEASAAYLREQLREGSTLEKTVAGRFDFSQGTYLILAPEKLDLTAISFSNGGICSAEDSLVSIAAIIHRFLKQDGRYVVLSHPFARPSDPWLNGYEFRRSALFFEREVYFHLPHGRLKEREILQIIKHAGHPFSGFFCQGKIEETSALVDVQDIRLFAQQTTAVARGVCDDETYLLWSFSNRALFF